MLSQWVKALDSMVVTLLGMVMALSLVQPRNSQEPMRFRPLGSETEVSWVQLENME